jgi:phosphonate utilization associated putative membrane protein
MANDVGLALSASVLMHVAWNLIARHQPREAEPLWWVLLAHAVLLGPWGLYSLITEVAWDARFVALLATSATANAVYFLGLGRAYGHAPVALVYPLVRSSPLLIGIWSWLLFAEVLGTLAWLGVALNVAGLLLMAATGRGNSEGRAMPWAMLAMLATSVYSLSDKAATGHVASFGGLVGYITVGYLVSWAMISLRLRRTTGRWTPRKPIRASAIVAGGLFIGLAYALVIHAMRFLPAAEVVAYTNAGIALATVISMVVYRERTHWPLRLVGTALVCAGLLSLALGRSGLELLPDAGHERPSFPTTAPASDARRPLPLSAISGRTRGARPSFASGRHAPVGKIDHGLAPAPLRDAPAAAARHRRLA